MTSEAKNIFYCSLSEPGDDKEKRRQILLRKRTMDSSVLEDLRGNMSSSVCVPL